MSDDILTVKLNNGVKIPLLGLQNQHDYSIKHINDGLISKIGLFVCTFENAKSLGEVMRSKIVQRDEIFIAYKLRIGEIHSGSIETVVRNTLDNLQLDYLDLCLLEWTPDLGISSLMDFWAGMEQTYELNLTRAIGLAHFDIESIGKILRGCRVIPTVNQIRKPSDFSLREFCDKHGIKIIVCQSDFDSFQHEITKMGTRYFRKPSEILLRYNLQLKNVVLQEWSLVDSVKDFYLAPEDMCFITSLL